MALAEKGADLEDRNNLKRTPLMVSAMRGSVKAVLMTWTRGPRERRG